MARFESSAYYTTRQAAEILGISVRTAQAWVEQGRLEAWKTSGGHRRITQESVQRLQTEKQGTGEPSREALQAYTEDRLKVLVVEDDRILLQLYRARLGRLPLPLDILTAPNAIEGLLLIGRAAPDLLITDMIMPALDGLTMVRTLCKSSFREGLTIVIVTGLPVEDSTSFEGIPEDVRILRKPVHFSELQRICEDLLEHRRQLHQSALSF